MSEIKQIIQKHLQNVRSKGELTLLTAQCVTILTASKARQRELEEQGHIKRFFRNLTGNNGKLLSAISGDIVTAQLAAHDMIQTLAQRQLLSIDILCAMQQKIHCLHLENKNEILRLYSQLDQVNVFLDQKIQILSDQVTQMETNISVIQWYLTKEQTNYNKLNAPSFALTIVIDFYTLTRGIWTDYDAIFIEKMLTDFQMNTPLSLSNIFQQEDLLHRVFKLVPTLPENDQMYLSDGMLALYRGVINSTTDKPLLARDLIHELLNTLVLIKQLTLPTKSEYQVILHNLEIPDNRIHVIRTLHVEAGLSTKTSENLTWLKEPSVIKVFDSEDEADKLKKALEKYKCFVTIEEIEVID